MLGTASSAYSGGVSLGSHPTIGPVVPARIVMSVARACTDDVAWKLRFLSCNSNVAVSPPLLVSVKGVVRLAFRRSEACSDCGAYEREAVNRERERVLSKVEKYREIYASE